TDRPAASTLKADRAAAYTEKVDREKELAEADPRSAQSYRTRVGEARLPDDIRKAALSEVGTLERISAENLEGSEIRIWLDTILDLPWSTETKDSIDIQRTREDDPAAADTHNLHTEKVDRAAADTKMVDREKVDPAAAEVETTDPADADPADADPETTDPADAKADTAPARPHDDDTVGTPAVLAVFSGGRDPRPQLVEQQVHGPVLVQDPPEKRRSRSLALAATASAALLIGALLLGASRDRGATAQSVPNVTATATVSKPTSQPSDESTRTGGAGSTIQSGDLPDFARPFQTVRIQGTYHGGANTVLRVQRWEEGKWLAFPLPTKTDQSGQFTTHVEFGQPGRYQLRVLDPDSGVTSKPFVLLIEG
ncbi:MAG TPA: hypothetical protein VF086_05290, partial [Propionibacteriaceae bacterium]